MKDNKSVVHKKFPHGPVRTCVICRAKALKKDLVRISLGPGAGNHHYNGRGAYVCTEHGSVQQIGKNQKKIAKALRCDVQALHIHLKGEMRS